MVMKQSNINKHKQRKQRVWNRLRRPQDDPGTTRQYTEDEIQCLARPERNGAGIIRPDTGKLHMPSGLAESGDGQQNSPPGVMVVIITLALIFITIITYLVSQMPPKNNELSVEKTQIRLRPSNSRFLLSPLFVGFISPFR